jgi:hypothetical protein
MPDQAGPSLGEIANWHRERARCPPAGLETYAEGLQRSWHETAADQIEVLAAPSPTPSEIVELLQDLLVLRIRVTDGQFTSAPDQSPVLEVQLPYELRCRLRALAARLDDHSAGDW